MTHEDASALLEAYFDGELDTPATLAVEAHLAGCAECRARLAGREALRDALALPGLRHAPPGRLGARLRARYPTALAAISWPSALAAGLVLAVSGFLLGRDLPARESVSAPLVTAHVRAALAASAVDVVSSDHHTVKPWLAAHLPYSPPVPELADAGERLLGARVDYLGHARVAALVYRHGEHLVDVFVWPRESAPRVAEAEIDGFRVLGGATDSFAVAIVSDAGAAELGSFRERWLAQAR
jgi:anti-sigma factor RsiW